MNEINTAANWIQSAAGLLILSGAGMGVDSGLPDFRGDRGFWKAYPMYERLGVRFAQAANPIHFDQDPEFGWGFYAHRLALYRQTEPHRGFYFPQQWAERFGSSLFAVTSNVDGQFQKAGFSDEQIFEVHGSIHHLQCTRPCSHSIWTNQLNIPLDLKKMRARNIPRCPSCDSVSRPNILMFGDPSWLENRTREQEQRFQQFLDTSEHENIVAIEIGAGLAVPTIRMMTERLARRGVRSIRINPFDASIAAPNLSLQLTGLSAFEQLNHLLAAA